MPAPGVGMEVLSIRTSPVNQSSGPRRPSMSLSEITFTSASLLRISCSGIDLHPGAEVAGSVVGYDVDEHLRRGGARGSYAGAAPRRLPGWLPPPSARHPGRGTSGWRRGWR